MFNRTIDRKASEDGIKRKLCRLVILAFAFIALAAPGVKSSAEGQDIPKGSGKLMDKAVAHGSVRIIVHLDAPFQPEGKLSGPTAVKSQQAGISRMQKKLHDAVSKHQVKGIKKFKHIPFITMEADAKALEALMASSLVKSIEEDVPVPPALTASIPLINADDAWNLVPPYTGSGWTVAILDTGVDKNHSFIGAGKVVAEACFSTNDTGTTSTTVCPNELESQIGTGAGIHCGGPDGTDIDGCQHGTHVAGIAAGRSASINGVAKDAGIISIQIFSKFTKAEYCTESSPCALSWSSDQILALEHVYSLRSTYNIASVNISLGGGKHTAYCDSDSRKAAIDNLRSAGIATVISSGNDDYTDGICAPACISSAVSVGAATKTDNEASYSNYHPTILSLFAPGSSIYSSVPGNGWETWNGTSMAAPHVTGAWAILKQKSPTASVTDLLNILQTTGAPVATKTGDLTGGSVQRIDVLAALAALDAGAPNAPTGLSGTAASISTINLSWTDNSADETGFRISRKTGTAGTYMDIGTTDTGVTAYLDSGLNEGTAYHYRVVAYNASGDSAYSNGASVATWLAAPSGLNATSASSSRINLNWTDNSGAETTFVIKRAAASGGPYTEIGTATVNETAYEDTGLSAGTTYYYQVTARNDNGDSTDSNEAFATTEALAFVAGGGGGGGGGGCFIATAAFGTPFEKHVSILRNFRDRFLLKTTFGRSFVKFYYEVSPPIADRIAQNESLRFMTRCILMPFVGVAYLMVTYGATITLLSIIFVTLFTAVLIRTVFRTRRTV